MAKWRRKKSKQSNADIVFLVSFIHVQRDQIVRKNLCIVFWSVSLRASRTKCDTLGCKINANIPSFQSFRLPCIHRYHPRSALGIDIVFALRFMHFVLRSVCFPPIPSILTMGALDAGGWEGFTFCILSFWKDLFQHFYIAEEYASHKSVWIWP